jgi:hypothetical protein
VAGGEGGAQRFEGLKGAVLTCREPLARAALLVLCDAWPEAVAFERLVDEACARPESGDGDALRKAAPYLAQYLLKVYLTAGDSLLELHVVPPAVVRAAGERPRTSPLTWMQAATNGPVTTLRHEAVMPDARERLLLRHLDGDHDRASLRELLGGTEPDEMLRRLARNAFLAK